MIDPTSELSAYGWTSYFSSQLSFDELTDCRPVRVVAVHRDRWQVAAPGLELSLPFGGADAAATAVGDWLLLDAQSLRLRRRLDRKSLFQRKAAGTAIRLQPIAANVDTLFIVSSCNLDFNPARLERYLALAREAGVTPLVVLTKADLSEAAADLARQAARLQNGLVVECLDGRDASAAQGLLPWCGSGQTVGLVGSSGVGKSTLAATLCGRALATQSIREDDARGRHTTTARTLYRLPGGGWLMDTPGMRELSLAEAGEGVAAVFADVLVHAAACRFADCSHAGEPGCAVTAAIEAGELDAARVQRWRKLAAEEAWNSESLAQRRARERTFGKLAKRVMEDKQRRRDR